MRFKPIYCCYVLAFFFLWSCQSLENDKSMEVEYVSDPCLIPVRDNRFRLCENMIIRVQNKYHAVPKGFKTDLASIPRIMWPLFAPTDYDSIAAAVLHDWHYCCVPEVTRLKADSIFYHGLRQHGMNRFEALLFWLGVRSWGWLHYTQGDGVFQHYGEFTINEAQGVYDNVSGLV